MAKNVSCMFCITQHHGACVGVLGKDTKEVCHCAAVSHPRSLAKEDANPIFYICPECSARNHKKCDGHTTSMVDGKEYGCSCREAGHPKTPNEIRIALGLPEYSKKKEPDNNDPLLRVCGPCWWNRHNSCTLSVGKELEYPCSCANAAHTYRSNEALEALKIIKDKYMAKNKRAEILEIAESLINGDRADTYGPPEVSFGRIADLWTAMGFHIADDNFGTGETRPINATDVALALTQIKVARIVGQPDHKDSWIDAAGYIALGAEIALRNDDN